MKILFLARKNLFISPGGDTIQIFKTKKYLEKKGIEILLSTDQKIDNLSIDLVHAFNLTIVGETYNQIKNAKKAGKIIILSPIYWSTDEFEDKGRGFKYTLLKKIVGLNNFERLKSIYKYFLLERDNPAYIKVFLHGYTKLQKKILDLSDYLLPNSQSEMIQIANQFGIKTKNYSIVPNGVDIDIFKYNASGIKERKYVLCIGRIDPRKNQLNVIKALNSLNLPAIFIGKPGHNHLRYYNVCKKVANKNIRFIDYIDQRELREFYLKSKVHVLASWFETPGLSSLEAGYCGCNIVVCDKGSVREYFGKYAFYCEPNNVNSIKEAIISAYYSEFPKELKNMIETNYNWEKAAEITFNAYKLLLNNNS